MPWTALDHAPVFALQVLKLSLRRVLEVAFSHLGAYKILVEQSESVEYWIVELGLDVRQSGEVRSRNASSPASRVAISPADVAIPHRGSFLGHAARTGCLCARRGSGC